MAIECPKVIATVFRAAQKEIPAAEYIGTRGDGEYLVLDARRMIIGKVTFSEQGEPQVEVFKIPAERLPN